LIFIPIPPVPVKASQAMTAAAFVEELAGVAVTEIDENVPVHVAVQTPAT
jgi:hypothetical protein